MRKNYTGPKPTITQTRTIEEFARLLKIDPPQPASEAEARFVIDELMARERKMRRARQREQPWR